jgi:hypothetical protein
MVHSIKRSVITLTALLIMLCLTLSVTEVAQSDTGANAPGKRDTARSSVVHDCTWATKHVRFAAVRVKKVRKRVVNGQLPVWKLKASLRIYKQAIRFKNQVCSSNPGGGGGGPQPPLALTASEVANQVFSRAAAYCNEDTFCYAYGNYDTSTCASKSTYTWSCYGYNLETYGDTCDFREVVSRSGYNGLTSYRDLTYGGSDGFFCS